MAKFSEIPHFIMVEYLNNLTNPDADDYMYLQGLLTGMVGDGGYWINMYALEDDGYTKIGFTPQIPNYVDDMFKFEKKSTSPSITNGVEIYIRNDSLFHQWIRETKPEYKEYINVNVTWLYFGHCYLYDTDNFYYNIEHYAMKNYVVAALPENNQTEYFTEFAKVYFDEVYSQPYAKTTDIFSLQDPIEVDENFLNYIAGYYNVTVDGFEFEELQKREYVKDVINLLKRKGSYTDLYIIYKIIAGNINNLNVYERWHTPSVSSGVPLPYFEDHHYIEYYGVEPSGGAGTTYYSQYDPASYPSAYGVNDGEMIISPHVKIEIDLSTEPMDDSAIISQTMDESLIDSWEMVRPVSKVHHYHELVAPLTDFSTDYVSMYDIEENINLYTKATQTEPPAPVSGSYISYHITPSTTWTANHRLNTYYPIVQCYDLNSNRLMPKIISSASSDSVTITFDEAEGGYVLLYKPTYVQSFALSTTWNVTHGQAIKENFISLMDIGYIRFESNIINLTDANNATITFDEAENGYATVTPYDYLHDQTSLASSSWTINHALSAQGVLTQYYDTNDNEIFPNIVELTDSQNVTATFSEAVSGYAVVKKCGELTLEGSIIDRIDYFKIGTGTTGSTYDVVSANDLENAVASSTNLTITYDSNYYYISGEIRYASDINITEIGIFDSNDDIVFYSYCSPIFNDSTQVFNIFMKVARLT